ncbi:uncharacterized protein TRIVIDRAFT_224243 [Trichoderma virens Gv29-8]|uniref:Uncharacterized protein n=1 Tax=Hypocrea virens (strain Gv29-8 / FGSC 10586) TaxID=413071 RepID=G9MZK8_HYPVG|nr:uncharacterized protein TRIVIDRAFT_224243 [Trichoderma virens Gv29-8]EHK20064.1 hypothetical protein TRIVIDRAFT_224243 [Trichoderma virens Gv29-8]UKZ45990.1 hypothetical protein TrVGV298_000186 [Trichoderma virens]
MSGPEESSSSFFGMGGKPPNYEDVEVITVNPNPRLRLRLEVWHFSTDGRSQKKNKRFAEVFKEANLENWDVQEVAVVEPDGASNRDDFVDFKHNEYTDNDPNGRAQNHVRELFRRIIPPIVFRFFLDIHSKPHTMSLVARNVSPDHQQRYCQLFIINKLNIRVDQLLTPAGFEDSCVDDIVARLSTLPNGLSTLSQIVEIFSMYQLLHGQTVPQFSFMHKQDADHVFNVRTLTLGDIEPLVTIAEELRPLYEANMNQSVADTLATKFQADFADVMGNLGKVKTDTPFTPQQLYETGLNLRTGNTMLLRARDFLGPHLERQIERYENDMRLPKNIRLGSVIAGASTGGAIFLGGLASNPLTLTIAVFLYAAVAAQGNIGAISKKNNAVKAFLQDLKDMADVFDEARRSVAVAVCQDVFNIGLDNLGQHERTAILHSFGIDVSALKYEEYRQSLVESSIDKLMTYYKEMGTNFEHMVRVCGHDLNDAKMPL